MDSVRALGHSAGHETDFHPRGRRSACLDVSGERQAKSAWSGLPAGTREEEPACIPPGQAKKLYDVGHHFPQGYNDWTPYNQIPYDLRQQYRLDPYGRYVFDQNYIYQVDPATMIVSQVLNAILR